jgi:hypothetical protein
LLPSSRPPRANGSSRFGRANAPTTTNLEPSDGMPMEDDRIVGDGGNVTVYERPDGSCYSLDKRGMGTERDPSEPVFGQARFDSRPLSNGRWEGSRSQSTEPEETDAALSRARRRSGRFRVA